MRKTIFALALALSANGATAQTPLTNYADAKGYLNVQELKCAQLAGTFQEDANALAIWYSGWYNGLAKKHYANIPRVREGIHQLIQYCKASPDKKIIEGLDALFKAERDAM